MDILADKPDLRTLLGTAWERRKTFRDDDSTDSYRIFHGYSEGLPGISIDRYGPCAIINKKNELPYEDADVAAALNELGDFGAIVMKTHQRIPETGTRRVRYLSGAEITEPLKVKEAGAYYFADHATLHSNGLYLDARPARRWLRDNSSGRRVLNLFAHTGSLGIAARLGGAKEVVYVDKHQSALEKVLLSYKYNGLRPDDRGLLAGDLYYHLPRAIKWGQKFSAIVLDPPPVVPPPPRVPKHRPEGQDFATLVETCCKLLDDGAWLFCIYHSYEKDHDQYDREITAASEGRLTPIWQATSDDDFPETDPNRRTRMTAFEFKL